VVLPRLLRPDPETRVPQLEELWQKSHTRAVVPLWKGKGGKGANGESKRGEETNSSGQCIYGREERGHGFLSERQINQERKKTR